MTTTEVKLTNPVKAMIGMEGEFVEVAGGIVEKEGLRRFIQALMDPDPRYWDEEFARSTRYGEIITPGIYVTYMSSKTPPWVDDPVTRALKENPLSDGVRGFERGGRGALPELPTDLVRRVNAGNEIEILQYPSLGDRIYCQSGYTDIKERIGRDGGHMLIVSTDSIYYNQRGDLLCIIGSGSIRR